MNSRFSYPIQPKVNATVATAATTSTTSTQQASIAGSKPFSHHPTIDPNPNTIYVAAREGDYDRVVAFYNTGKIDVNDTDFYGNSPLYYACLCGHIRVIKYLLDNGARDDKFRRCHWNALHERVRSILAAYTPMPFSFHDYHDECVIALRTNKPNRYAAMLPNIINQYDREAAAAAVTAALAAAPVLAQQLTNYNYYTQQQPDPTRVVSVRQPQQQPTTATATATAATTARPQQQQPLVVRPSWWDTFLTRAVDMGFSKVQAEWVLASRHHAHTEAAIDSLLSLSDELRKMQYQSQLPPSHTGGNAADYFDMFAHNDNNDDGGVEYDIQEEPRSDDSEGEEEGEGEEEESSEEEEEEVVPSNRRAINNNIININTATPNNSVSTSNFDSIGRTTIAAAAAAAALLATTTTTAATAAAATLAETAAAIDSVDIGINMSVEGGGVVDEEYYKSTEISTASFEEFMEREICKICFESVYETCFVPCGHLGFCTKCSAPLVECPVCREVIQQKVVVIRV